MSALPETNEDAFAQPAAARDDPASPRIRNVLVVDDNVDAADSLAYGAWRAMYWAKERGIIASLDPYANFINRDKAIVSRIIQNAKYLQQ